MTLPKNFLRNCLMIEHLFIIDTNTLLSASLFENSKTKIAYDKAKKMGNIIVSDATFSEISEVLVRPKFERYVRLSTRKQAIEDF